MNDLVSVIIPTYQHAAVLPACLDSIISSTHKNLEIIVIDDGSTDNTKEVLEPYKQKIAYIHQENLGANAARNRGFEASTGAFVLFCDADILLAPNAIEEWVVALARNPEASYAYSAFRFSFKKFRGIPFDDALLKKRNFIHTTSLIRREDFPGFDEKIRRLQDWDLWLTMLESGKRGVLVDKELFRVRVEGKSRIGSQWLPSFIYRMPWKPKAVRAYEDTKRIIVEKHNL